MGVLTGQAIEEGVAAGDIYIDPFDCARVGINSYDVLLDRQLLVYTIGPMRSCLDMRLDNPVEAIQIPDTGLRLSPGTLYLGSTVEMIGSDKYVPWLDGRSSVGRLGISVHVTAGRGDLGFSGNRERAATWTLEITVVHPIVIYPFVRIGQVSFLVPSGEISRLYSGRYAGQSGPIASRFWQGGGSDVVR